MDNDNLEPSLKKKSAEAGLLSAFHLDGKGGAESIKWKGVRDWTSTKAALWVHLDRNSQKAQSWLIKQSGLNSLICDALLAEETRPRAQAFGSGMLVILRGANLNPGAEPDDMISIRIWVEAERIITLRAPRLLAVSDVQEELRQGNGPLTPAEALVRIVEQLSQRISPVVSNLDELTDNAEDKMLEVSDGSLRRDLTNIRRQAIAMRRYIAPQREAISNLKRTSLAWINESHKAALHECGDRSARFVEDLDSIRERASIVHEELAARMSEQMNRNYCFCFWCDGIFDGSRIYVVCIRKNINQNRSKVEKCNYLSGRYESK